jgi:hypothetical protein
MGGFTGKASEKTRDPLGCKRRAYAFPIEEIMATRKIESPESLKTDALNAARKSIDASDRAKGFSKVFTAKVLRLGTLLGTADAQSAAESLGKELEALAGGKGYASNAKRILSAGIVACQKALDYCESPENSGFMSPANLFKKFPDTFPVLNATGRAAAPKQNEPTGIDLTQPAGWLVALEAVRANAPKHKTWASDDIVAMQDSAAKMIALIKRNSK